MKIILVATAIMLAGPAIAQTSAIQSHEQALISSAGLAQNDIVAGIEEADDAYAPVMAHIESTTFTGMGGPIEEQTGYPPCSLGPGDDECIQLYERGVTGAGN